MLGAEDPTLGGTTARIARLVADHGEGIAVVRIDDALSACLSHELPDVLDRWIDAQAIPFSPRARAAGYAGLRAALANGAGVPVIELGPSTIRLRWYELAAGRVGAAAWSYVEN